MAAMETKILSLCFLFFFLISNGGTEAMESNCKVHFVLVHGFSGGGWQWYKIRTLLEQTGYKVSCPDLKSAGIDPTNWTSVKTFDDYNQPLIRLLSTIPPDEKVILVGHSAGGLSVTDAIYKFGNKIDLAIYIGATMLRQGYLTEEDEKMGIPGGSGDGESDLCPEDVALVRMLKKEGPRETITSVKYQETPGVVDEVRRVYIKTMQDGVWNVGQQDAMIMKWPPSDVFVIESDHSPNISKSSDLFKLLVKAASVDITSISVINFWFC